jgi:hypothetical protein
MSFNNNNKKRKQLEKPSANWSAIINDEKYIKVWANIQRFLPIRLKFLLICKKIYDAIRLSDDYNHEAEIYSYLKETFDLIKFLKKSDKPIEFPSSIRELASSADTDLKFKDLEYLENLKDEIKEIANHHKELSNIVYLHFYRVFCNMIKTTEFSIDPYYGKNKHKSEISWIRRKDRHTIICNDPKPLNRNTRDMLVKIKILDLNDLNCFLHDAHELPKELNKLIVGDLQSGNENELDRIFAGMMRPSTWVELNASLGETILKILAKQCYKLITQLGGSLLDLEFPKMTTLKITESSIGHLQRYFKIRAPKLTTVHLSKGLVKTGGIISIFGDPKRFPEFNKSGTFVTPDNTLVTDFTTLLKRCVEKGFVVKILNTIYYRYWPNDEGKTLFKDIHVALSPEIKQKFKKQGRAPVILSGEFDILLKRKKDKKSTLLGKKLRYYMERFESFPKEPPDDETFNRMLRLSTNRYSSFDSGTTPQPINQDIRDEDGDVRMNEKKPTNSY